MAPPLVPHKVTIGAGTLMTGGDESTTTTANPHDPTLPAASVAVHCTQLLPSGKSEPDGGTQTAVILESQLSVTPTEKVTGVPVVPAHGTVIVPGQNNSGGSVSNTMSVAGALVNDP